MEVGAMQTEEELMMYRSAELIANAFGDEALAQRAAILVQATEATLAEERRKTFKQLCSKEDVIRARALGIKLF
jgi:hypothetical protein